MRSGAVSNDQNDQVQKTLFESVDIKIALESTPILPFLTQNNIICWKSRIGTG